MGLSFPLPALAGRWPRPPAAGGMHPPLFRGAPAGKVEGAALQDHQRVAQQALYNSAQAVAQKPCEVAVQHNFVAAPQAAAAPMPTLESLDSLARQAEQMLRENTRGTFAILHEVAVMESAGLNAPIVATLAPGAVVVVVGVWPHYEEGRVRARVESPAGWLSVLCPQDGFRWAAPQRPGPLRMEGLLDGERVGLQLSQTLRVRKLTDSRAALSGWCVSDQILEVNGIPVGNEENFLHEVHRANLLHRQTRRPLFFTIERAPPPEHGLAELLAEEGWDEEEEEQHSKVHDRHRQGHSATYTSFNGGQAALQTVPHM